MAILNRSGTPPFVDPDGTIGILLAQVELDEPILAHYDEFQSFA